MKGARYSITLFLTIIVSWAFMGITAANVDESNRGSKELRLESVDEIAACCEGEPVQTGRAVAKEVHEQGLMVDRETYASWKEQARHRKDVPRGTILLPAEEALFLPSAPIITKKFEGADKVQAGGGFPPDTNIAVSKTHVLEAVNFLYRLSTKTNTNILTIPISNFHKRAGNFIFDPRVFYDRFSDRFVVVGLEFDGSPQTSFIHLAVSRSGSPTDLTTSWCFYKIPGKVQGAWSDYPNVGMNEKWMVISVNLFKFAGNNYVKNLMKVVDLSALAKNTTICPRIKTFTFSDSTGSIYPAQYHTQTGLPDHPLFMVSSFNAPMGNSYSLFKVSGAGNPSISKSTISTTSTYGFPPDALQKGGGTLLETGDVRLIDAEFRNGSIFFAHSTACNFTGGSSNSSCIRVSKLNVSGTAAFEFQLTIGGGENNFFWFPGVGVNSTGDIALVFQQSGKTRPLGLAHSGKKAAAANLDPFKIIKQGTCNLLNLDPGGRNRTGDYVGIHVDPSDDKSFWYAAEYTKKFGSSCGWATFIVQTK